MTLKCDNILNAVSGSQEEASLDKKCSDLMIEIHGMLDLVTAPIKTIVQVLGLTPEQAINAVTINGAAAMELNETHGSIGKGKKANIIITKNIPSYSYIPYSFGSNLVETVIISGNIQNT